MARWRSIEGWPYEVSDDGRVRREDGFVMSVFDCGNGYLRVNLRKKGARKQCFVHRLIAEAFIDNPHRKETVNHIDGDPSNNILGNLEWATQRENVQHAIQAGLRAAGNPTVARQVLCSKTGRAFATVKEAAEFVGMKRQTLNAQLKGQNPNRTTLVYSSRLA